MTQQERPAFDTISNKLQIVRQKMSDTQAQISVIEAQITDLKTDYESADTETLEKKLKKLRSYFAGLCNAENILLKRQEFFTNQKLY